MARRRAEGALKKRYQKSVLIVCEGKNTEPTYFKALVKALRLDATIEVSVVGDTQHTDPSGLLKDAVKLRNKRKQEAKRSLVLRSHDEVWVVFDTEWPGKHGNLAQAISDMFAQGFQAAISSPSFETWFILHDRPTAPSCACCDEAVVVLKKMHRDLADYGKGAEATQKCVNWSFGDARLALALKHGHAQPIERFHATQPVLPTSTATSVHLLVQKLVEACDDDPVLDQLGLS